MIKKSALRRIMIATLGLLILLIIYFFPTKNTFKETVTYIKQEEIPIFLIDNLEYVARTSIIKNSENTEELIKEVINSLIVDSHKSNYIHEGFRAIIPKDTKLLDMDLQDGILTLNFNENFLNVSSNDEEKMLEALIYSLLEIKDIQKIVLYVNGDKLTHLPNSGKKIPEYLDKSYGINKVFELNNLKESTKTTIYYLSKFKGYHYYIPITKISNDTNEKVEVIIKELKSTPIYNTNLISYLTASSNLSTYELLENSIALSFNNKLLANLDNNDILEEVKYSIALSIRDNYGITEVIFNLPNQENSTIKLWHRKKLPKKLYFL